MMHMLKKLDIRGNKTLLPNSTKIILKPQDGIQLQTPHMRQLIAMQRTSLQAKIEETYTNWVRPSP